PGTTAAHVRGTGSGRRVEPGQIQRGGKLRLDPGTAGAGDEPLLPAIPLRVFHGLLGALSREAGRGERSEVQAVAQKYLDPKRAHIVAVGDAAKIRGALEKFGKIS